MSDYLWDKSGETDADVARLEDVLGRLRHAGRAPELPFETGAQASAFEVESRSSSGVGPFGRAFFSRPARLAAAAALLLAVIAGAFALMRTVRKDGDRASVNNATQVEQPRPIATEEATPREEVREPELAVSQPKQSATPERTQRETQRRDALAFVKSSTKPQRREPAPRETVATQATPREVKTAMARGGVLEGGASDVERRVRAKEQIVYALRLTSEALKQVRGRASGVGVRGNAFDGRAPLR